MIITSYLHKFLNYRFLGKTPALYYGISFFLGLEVAFHQNYFILIPLISLLLLNLRSAWLAILLALAGFCYTTANYSYTPIDPCGMTGLANIKIEGISLIKSRFGAHWYYKGSLLSFISEQDGTLQESIKNIPITFRFKANKTFRPLADSAYLIPCALFPGDGKRYKMKLDSQQSWQKVKQTFSLAEIRYKVKLSVNKFIKSCFRHKNSQDFLAGLVTGEFNDDKMKAAFSKFGLLHLMAISGFHFSLFASIFIFLLRPYLSPYKVTALVTLILTLYFFFLGSGPSILRAWMMTITCFGTLISKRPLNSRNALGIALIVTLLIEPSLCNHMGFQFSFLITAAILFCCQPVEQFLLYLFPKKERGSLEEFTWLEKHLLLIFSFFRPVIALNLVTTSAALPLSLYYFQKFPVLSFFYNIYFPLLVTLSLFLLVLGLIFYPIPLISSTIHIINDHFTHFILNMTIDVPKKLDIYWRVENISECFLITYYTIFFIIFIFIYYKYCNRSSSQKLII